MCSPASGIVSGLLILVVCVGIYYICKLGKIKFGKCSITLEDKK